jgi:O-antigen/teichoic acid export membrane protein
MTRTVDATPFRRTLVLMTASSFLVPAAGVLTSPMLAQALGVTGRGELAAALAPSALVVAVATLGLPEALTYYVAKHPQITRQALACSILLTACTGVLCLIGSVVTLPFLSTGDAGLGKLIVLATALSIPALVVGVLRGAASGRQMWTAVAVERLINTMLRVALFGILLVLGHLTVLTAVLVSSLAPLCAGAVYWRVWATPRDLEGSEPFMGNLRRALTSFGCRMWLGAVASMLVARVAPLLVAPLSNLYELGLYTVATTISDVPLIVALAVRDALYGINSRTNDARQITTTSRMAVLIGAIGCAAIGGTLPLWLGGVFGEEFREATVSTWMLMFSALLCIPGLMAAAGLSAWGRPGLRSLGLAVTLVANASALIVLVPRMGAIGAAWTSIISNVVMTSFMCVAASRVMKVPAADFLLIRPQDIARVYREVRAVAARLRRRRTDQV